MISCRPVSPLHHMPDLLYIDATLRVARGFQTDLASASSGRCSTFWRFRGICIAHGECRLGRRIVRSMIKLGFQNAKLDGASFVRANMVACYLEFASLKNAVLVDAVVAGGDLAGADLEGADVAGADFMSADFHPPSLRASATSRPRTTSIAPSIRTGRFAKAQSSEVVCTRLPLLVSLAAERIRTMQARV